VAQSKDSGKILEEVKKQGKFKPIGFKHIRNSGKREKKKKLKSGDRTTKCGERKRKKHKVEAEPQAERKTELPLTAEILTLMPTTSKENTGGLNNSSVCACISYTSEGEMLSITLS